MTEEEKFKIIDNNYLDLIIKYNGDNEYLKQFDMYTIHIVNNYIAIIYIPIDQVTSDFIGKFIYSDIPKCHSLSSKESLDASGVSQLRRIPATNLRGNGVIVGIIDTGIDYTNPVFQNADGTTKIISIWDQSIDSENQYPYAINPTYYGTEYTTDQINNALKSENPLQVVPSTDENGHGTMMAGIAAGSENIENNFSGVVPDAQLMVVKLKQAKESIMDFFRIPKGVPCYQENDIIWAIRYLVYGTRRLHRPLALCIGLGTSQGAHDNTGLLNTLISIYGDTADVALSVAVGNEGNAKRHFFSSIDPASGPVVVELNVGENESGFSMELWGDPPTVYTLDIQSPTGEYIPIISELIEGSRIITFLFEKTVININYVMIEQETGKQLILLRFTQPTKGIWKFNVYAKGDVKGSFHIWLPSDNFITQNTFFVRADAFTTITSPANSLVPISITAYNSDTGAIYLNSGKGFSTSNIINPSLAAPGVNIQCPTLDHGFTSMTGTSAAVAHTAGITAMILEWSVVKNNLPGIDTNGIKNFLIRGAERSNNLHYPNQEWGYGIIDVYNSFNILRTDFQ